MKQKILALAMAVSALFAFSACEIDGLDELAAIDHSYQPYLQSKANRLEETYHMGGSENEH